MQQKRQERAERSERDRQERDKRRKQYKGDCCESIERKDKDINGEKIKNEQTETLGSRKSERNDYMTDRSSPYVLFIRQSRQMPRAYEGKGTTKILKEAYKSK